MVLKEALNFDNEYHLPATRTDDRRIEIGDCRLAMKTSLYLSLHNTPRTA
jgi:hypothetical protein